MRQERGVGRDIRENEALDTDNPKVTPAQGGHQIKSRQHIVSNRQDPSVAFECPAGTGSGGHLTRHSCPSKEGWKRDIFVAQHYQSPPRRDSTG